MRVAKGGRAQGSGVPRGGAKGTKLSPPKPENQGAKLSFGPPFEVYKLFFQIYTIYYY